MFSIPEAVTSNPSAVEVSKMKMLMFVLAVSFLATMFLGGCSFDHDGTAETAMQKRLKHKQIHYWNMRQFHDEWEMFWLRDKNLRGSRYPVRIGN